MIARHSNRDETTAIDKELHKWRLAVAGARQIRQEGCAEWQRFVHARRSDTTMPLSPTPHDALFRALVSDGKRAAALLMEYPPAKVADIIDWSLTVGDPASVETTITDGDGLGSGCRGGRMRVP